VSQKSQSGFFSATDLVLAGNKWRIENNLPFFNLASWLKNDSTKSFIAALEADYGGSVKINSKGKGHHTWVHPFLFIDLALAINPELKIEVYKWLYDELLRYRNDSGDSYKRMCGALWVNAERKDLFSTYIKDVARRIKEAVGVDSWDSANVDNLRMRDKMHHTIAVLAEVLRHNDDAVRIGIIKTIDQITDKKELT
jgi:hypothetical protein